MSTWAAYRRSLLALATSAPRADVLAGVAVALARALGVPSPSLAADPLAGAVDLELPVGLAGPDLLGRALEALLDPTARRADGAHFTPAAVADGVVAEARRAADAPGDRPVVADPAVGGGAFLLAAARSLHRGGLAADEVVDDLLWGVDVDPLAVSVSSAALGLWAATAGGRSQDRPAPHVVVGDWLDAGLALGPADGFDVVVGNPPFLGQLATSTARDREAAAAAEAWLGPAVHGYADTSALFLVAALRRTRRGGRVALLQPMSFLGAAHAAPARADLLDRAELVGLWVGGPGLFGASVAVCAPVLEVGARSGGPVRLTAGPDFAGAGDAAVPVRSWAPLAARAAGVPAVEPVADGRSDVGAQGTLADLATATAGFRQQFYGLAPHVVEADGGDRPPLVTCGLVDPLRCRWGEADTRFAGRRWRRPAVDLDAVRADDPKLAGWVADRLVPKVVVATQTRVIEAAVDVAGAWVPSVPLISVEVPPERLWDVAVVLLAPATSALALADAWGTGLASDTVRLSARQLLALALPADRVRWEAAAAALERAAPSWPADAATVGAAMNAAYGLPPDHPSLTWWLARLPPRR